MPSRAQKASGGPGAGRRPAVEAPEARTIVVAKTTLVLFSVTLAGVGIRRCYGLHRKRAKA